MSAMGELVLDIQEACYDVMNDQCSIDSTAKQLGVPVEWVEREFNNILMHEGYVADAYY